MLGIADRTAGRGDPRLLWGGLGLFGQDVALGLGFALLAAWAQDWARGSGWVPDQPGALALIGWATGVAIALRRRWPMLTLLLTGLVYPLLYVSGSGPAGLQDLPSGQPITGVPTVPLLIALYQCAATGRPRLRWVALLGAVGIGLLTFPVLRVIGLLSGQVPARDYLLGTQQPITPFTVAVAVLPLTVMLTSMALGSAAVLLGRAVFRQQRTVAELSRRNHELHRLRGVEAERTVAAERSRIARELHDVVAHHISAVVIRAQAADRVADTRPDEARAAVGWIAETGQEALAAMRHVVRVLRSSSAGQADLAPGPTLADLPEVADRLTAVGLPVELHLPDPLPALPAEVDLAAVRITQEALTNVLVHAGASRAVAQILVERGALVIDVQDDGNGEPAGPGAGGHGLIGMRERAAVCGGQLVIGRSPLGGWEVTARLPLRGGLR